MLKTVTAAGAALVVAVVVLGAAAGAGFGGPRSSMTTTRALSEIPADYLPIYREAAATCPGLPWTVLAGVGRVESDHGRNAKTSSAGAVGPMQFMPATFAAYAHPVPPGGAKPASPLDPIDAIHAAARLLCANGARGGTDIPAAIYSYNHARWYVAEVIGWAIAYGWVPGDRSLLETAVLDHPNLDLRAEAAIDVSAQRVDPRVLAALLTLATRHSLGFVGPFVTGHSIYVRGTDRISNHAVGRAVDIPYVDGAPVSATNTGARDVARTLLRLPPPLRPDELGSPWGFSSPTVTTFTDGHDTHIHYGVDAA